MINVFSLSGDSKTFSADFNPLIISISLESGFALLMQLTQKRV